MDEDRASRSDEKDAPPAKPDWRVDGDASRARLRRQASADGPPPLGGRMIYTDEQGHPRRLPADMGRLSRDEVVAAAGALSDELGAAKPSYAQIAAVERLNELHAAGRFSDEDYEREKRRLLGRD